MSCYLVTGAAGFIGSHLCEALLERGLDVVGVDAFIPYYPRAVKEANLGKALGHPRFTFHETDLRSAPLHPLLEGCEAVFHLAAMPGLMRSWSDFELYSSCNLLATQRLLATAVESSLPHFIQVSTSSVYGKEAAGPEDGPLAPFSPYGLTKLAAEHLCRAYAANFDLPFTILRYFSVYGPRQRPDMAYQILIRKLLSGEPFTLFGDGEQTRSNTYVDDCVRATLLAFENRDAALGETFNIGGGEVVTLRRAIALLEELTGRQAVIRPAPPRPGDQKHTAAHIDKARRLLGYEPSTPIQDGLRAEVEWMRNRSSPAADGRNRG